MCYNLSVIEALICAKSELGDTTIDLRFEGDELIADTIGQYHAEIID